MTSDYQLHVGALGWADDTVTLDVEGDREAIFTAFGAATPFGHALWAGPRFLGYFDGGAGRIPYVAAEYARHQSMKPPERRP